ncbi:sigma-E factor negative regulatory protein [Planctobacterium marinum]|uniref:sigma-E factor negative regulatory protein n=1 Tax=Planctobacterium marinum TaxID=1631968 RepID=UPI001E391CDE|nr:RseA family anti-sigma factor [Planctobacterium marinum]MCC2604755.1 transcriptional regulator [Planctobacterium marinum]
MTQSKIENLSALVDGEQTDSKLLDELASDAELASRWQSYHLIKDGLRGELPDSLNLNIADAVAEAIENEPAIVAPNLKTQKDKKSPVWGNVVPLFRQGGQFAIAASVAVAVILGYQQFNQTSQDSDLNIAPVKAISGIPSGMSPVSLSQDRAVPKANVAEQRRKLNALLADHQQRMMLKTADDETVIEAETDEDSQQQEPK